MGQEAFTHFRIELGETKVDLRIEARGIGLVQRSEFRQASGLHVVQNLDDFIGSDIAEPVAQYTRLPGRYGHRLLLKLEPIPS